MRRGPPDPAGAELEAGSQVESAGAAGFDGIAQQQQSRAALGAAEAGLDAAAGVGVGLAAVGQEGRGLAVGADALLRDFMARRAVHYSGLVNAEFFVCQAASVGSVMRRYGASAEKAEAWRALCERDPEGEIVGPPGS